MILTIKGADFSGSGLGTNTSMSISYNGNVSGTPGFIEKNTALTSTITINTGYTYDSITSVTVGGQSISGYTATDNGDGTVTLTIPANKITGRVVVTVSTTATSGGEVVDPEPEEPGTGGDSGETPSVPTIYRTNKTLGIQIMEFGDFKFQSNSTTMSPSYCCQVVSADVSNYVGKTITISTTHAYIKNNSTYGDAYYCFFLNAAPNNKTPEMLPSITKLSDLGTTSGNSNMDVILSKDIIVEKFDIVSTGDTYSTKSVTVPEGAKYVYFTHTRKGGSDKEANIIFN